jgi:peptidoglycan/LPS O-acetylase OafA/YrhL
LDRVEAIQPAIAVAPGTAGLRTRQATVRLDALQVLRAFAALAIVLRHSLSDAAALDTGFVDRGRHAFEQLAAGVDLFFVISGFVMVYASQRLFGAAGGTRTFLFERLTRIVPLYWITTTLFLAVAWLSPHSLNSEAPSATMIAASYFFIPAARPDGVVRPFYELGWTLNYEMFFYAIFGLALVWRRGKAVAAVAGVLLVLVFLGEAVRPSAPAAKFWTNSIVIEFVFGMAIAQAYLAGMRLNRALSLALIGAGVVLLALDPTLWMSFAAHRSIAWGVPAALIVAGAVLADPKVQPTPVVRLAVGLGDASYALYLTHPFAMRFMKIVWSKLGLTSIAGTLPYVILALASAVCLAVMVYRFVERPILKALRGR